MLRITWVGRGQTLVNPLTITRIVPATPDQREQGIRSNVVTSDEPEIAFECEESVLVLEYRLAQLRAEEGS